MSEGWGDEELAPGAAVPAAAPPQVSPSVRVKCTHVEVLDVPTKVVEGVEGNARLHDCMRRATVCRFATDDAEGTHPKMEVRVEYIGVAEHIRGKHYLVNIIEGG